MPPPTPPRPGSAEFQAPEAGPASRRKRKKPPPLASLPRPAKRDKVDADEDPALPSPVARLGGGRWANILFPPDAAVAAATIWNNPERMKDRALRLTFPQKALRVAGPTPPFGDGYTQSSLVDRMIHSKDRAAKREARERLDRMITHGFVGAVLCGCIKIEKHLMDGGYGRGWQAMFTLGDTRRRVFVKTLGTGYSDRYEPQKELIARTEASVFVHPWFPAATDQPGAATARLLYGRCVNVKTGFDDNVFFICGELCQAGELWAHITPPAIVAGHADHGLEERFAKRIFGQVARTLLIMKHCGENESPTPRLARAPGRKRTVKGCFHRDVKLENMMVGDDFDVKLIDYGSLKFTDQMKQFVSPGGAYTSPTLTTATPDVGTVDFLEPSLLRGPGFSRKDDVKDGRYDPAARDVWTLAEVLFFLVAGSEMSRLLGPHKYSFFFIALARESKSWPEDWRVLKTQIPKSLFYRVDGALSLDGVPPTDRDPKGTPLLSELWGYIPNLDPARDGALSPELKDLLNRMFDVDPKRRITIEEVCEHPWLASHQAPGDGVPEETIETESEHATYLAEMKRRFTQYVERKYPRRVGYRVRDFSIEALQDAVDRYSSDRPFKAGRCDNLIEVFRTQAPLGSPAIQQLKVIDVFDLPIFEAWYDPAQSIVGFEWVTNVPVTLSNGESANNSASIAEWNEFVNTLRVLVSAVGSPVNVEPPPRPADEALAE